MRVEDLIERFAVTPATLRKDLTYLEKSDLITRSRGEAHLKDTSMAPPLLMRGENHADDKLAIARVACSLVGDDDSLILDAGTTTLAIAKQLTGKKGLTVITNSLPAAYILVSRGVSVMMSGGTLQANSMSLVGPEAEQFFGRITANTLFLGAVGIREDFGLTVSSSFESNVKQQMIRAAKKIYAVIDASKFTKASVIQFAAFNELSAIITNRSAAETPVAKKLEDRGVKMIYAD